MTEEFTLQQVFRNGRAVDREKRLFGSLTVIINRAGDHLFARSAFAKNQDSDVLGRDASDSSIDFLHCGAMTDQQVAAGVGRVVCGDFCRPPHEPTGFCSGLNKWKQCLGTKRLQNVFEGTGLHGMNCRVRRTLASHKNHGNSSIGFLKLLKQIET